MPSCFYCNCGNPVWIDDEETGIPTKCPACGEVVNPADDLPKSGAGQESTNPPITLERADTAPRAGDADTVASNPGKLRVQTLFYCRCFPARPLVYSILLLAFIVLAIYCHYVFWVGVVIELFALMYWKGKVTDKFQDGCICPSVVVSTNPPLLAVYMNLRTSHYRRGFPVIRVLHQPLGQMSAGPPEIGQRLAACSVCTGGDEKAKGRGHWDDVEPQVVNCVTQKPADLKRVQSTIAFTEWVKLRLGLEQIPQSCQPGFYWLYLPAVRWAICSNGHQWHAETDAGVFAFDQYKSCPTCRAVPAYIMDAKWEDESKGWEDLQCRVAKFQAQREEINNHCRTLQDTKDTPMNWDKRKAAEEALQPNCSEMEAGPLNLEMSRVVQQMESALWQARRMSEGRFLGCAISLTLFAFVPLGLLLFCLVETIRWLFS